MIQSLSLFNLSYFEPLDGSIGFLVITFCHEGLETKAFLMVVLVTRHFKTYKLFCLELLLKMQTVNYSCCLSGARAHLHTAVLLMKQAHLIQCSPSFLSNLRVLSHHSQCRTMHFLNGERKSYLFWS